MIKNKDKAIKSMALYCVDKGAFETTNGKWTINANELYELLSIDRSIDFLTVFLDLEWEIRKYECVADADILLNFEKPWSLKNQKINIAFYTSYCPNIKEDRMFKQQGELING